MSSHSCLISRERDWEAGKENEIERDRKEVNKYKEIKRGWKEEMEEEKN